jgi:succinate dehydrogenase / fumarate reductase cytochrome b subunit
MTGIVDVEEMDEKYFQQEKLKEEVYLGERTIIVRDLYKEVSVEFKQEWWLVALYVLSMAAISFHLVHGFKSAFQTLGISHKKYNGLIHFIGVWFFGIIIPIGFAAMPLYFMFK